jgi:hypothetical protein
MSHRVTRAVVATVAVVAALAGAAAPARAIVRLPATMPHVTGNPADRLGALPIEGFHYDPATHCVARPKPGMTRLVRWLQSNAGGVAWGTYRCEKWGKGSASLHAEGRALDWHLDVRNPADAAEARRIIFLLLSPDRHGNVQALARRMGVEEIIWDCGYWSSGMTQFKPYSICYDAKGRRRAKVDPTQAHRDHLHLGLTKAGAAAKTSFWTTTAR